MADETVQVEISAIDRASQVMRQISGASNDLMQTLTSILTPTRLLGSVIGYELVNAARAAVDQFVRFAFQIRDLSYLSGGSARDVSVLVNGLDALGVETQTAERALNLMSRAVEAGSPALMRLGVNVRDNAGQLKSGLALFYETIDALGGMRNEIERNALSREIFGRGWVEMVPVLAMGSQKIRDLGEAAAAAGKMMDEEGIKRAHEYNLALHEFSEAIEAIKLTIGPGLLVPITFLIKGLAPSAARAGRHLEQQLLGEFGVGSEMLGGGNIVGVTETIPGPVGGAWPAAPVASTVAELQRRVVAAQIAQMGAAAGVARAGAQPEGLQRMQAELEAGAALIKASRDKDLADLAVALRKGERTEQEAAAARVQINAKADAEIAKLRATVGDQMRTANLHFWEATQKDIDAALLAQRDAEYEAGADWVDIDRETEAELLRQRLELAEDTKAVIAGEIASRTQYYRDVEHGAEVTTDQVLNTERRQFAEMKRLYDDDVTRFVNDRVLKSGLLADQTRKNQDALAEWYTWLEARRKQDYQSEAIILRGKAEEQGSLWLAMQAGAVKTYGDLGTFWGNVSEGFAHTFQNVNRSLSDTFFDVMTGQFDKLGDVVKNFGLSMVRTFTDVLSAEATKGLIRLLPIEGLGGGGAGMSWGDIFGGIGSAVSGAWDWLGNAASGIGSFLGFLQTGMWNVPDRPGYELAILHPGEMVLPPGVAASVRAQGGIYSARDQAWLFGPNAVLTGQGGQGEPGFGGPGAVTAADMLSNAIAQNLSGWQQAGFVGAHIANFGLGFLGLATAPSIIGAIATFAGIASRAAAINEWGLETAFGLSPDQAKSIAADFQSFSTETLDSIAEAFGSLGTALGMTAGQMNDMMGDAYGVSGGWSDVGAAWGGGGLSGGNTGGFGGFGGSDMGSSADTGIGGGGLYARGGLFTATGPTGMIVGEAGPETVGIIRNPREVEPSGSGSVVINNYIDARGSLLDAREFTELVRERIVPEIAQLMRLRHGPGWGI